MRLHKSAVFSTLFLVGVAFRISYRDAEQQTTGLTRKHAVGQARGQLIPTKQQSEPRPLVGFSPYSVPDIAYGHRGDATLKHSISPLEEVVDGEEASGYTFADFIKKTNSMRAPMRTIGAYLLLSLRLPYTEPTGLPTPELEDVNRAQEMGSETGVKLDFVVSTASNVNTVREDVVSRDLRLEAIGKESRYISSMGEEVSANLYSLGDVQLNDASRDGLFGERRTVASGLVASAVPDRPPVGVGLLGLDFLLSFDGGVEFNWGDPAADDAATSANATEEAADVSAPSLTMYRELLGNEGRSAGMEQVPTRELRNESGMVVIMTVNGVAIPAVLDTGCPITVLNAEAARFAGIKMLEQPEVSDKSLLQKVGPLAMKTLTTAVKMGTGDMYLYDAHTGPVFLPRIPDPAMIALGGAQLGEARPFVGELPSLDVLNGLGEDAGPAAILGLDLLRTRKRLLLQNQKVFIE
jgi:hypothetical protein